MVDQTCAQQVLKNAARNGVRKLEQVEAQLVELRELRKSESADDEHDPEGVSLSSEWSRLEGRKQSRLENLASIDEAAERFQRGEATNCDVCGTPHARHDSKRCPKPPPVLTAPTSGLG